MKAQWQKYLAANVPRYTSYPSALRMRPEIGSDEYAGALTRIGLYEPISLYLHVPFCRQLCWYCGCNMRVENKDSRIARYVDHLIEEIEQVGTRLGGRGAVSQLHFGGGTPNILAAEDIDRILIAVEEQFGLTDSTPVVMEIDPRLGQGAAAAGLARLGVNRFSIGVQDFDPEVQAAINRLQPFELVEDCMAQLRMAGVRDISLDVLYGLPHQTLCRFRKTIDQVIALLPDRVSLFGYAHMPSRFRHQQLIDDDALPDRSLRIALAESAASRLMAAGYERVGFDHFALPDTPLARAAHLHRLNRNFQGFTEDPAQIVIGLGVSAISSIHGLIVQNAKSVSEYRDRLAERGLATTNGIIATLEEEELGDWIRGLLCNMEASLTQYFEITGRFGAAGDEVLDQLKPFGEDGVIRFDADKIIINENAKALARAVVAVFDPEVGSDRQFASPAV